MTSCSMAKQKLEESPTMQAVSTQTAADASVLVALKKAQNVPLAAQQYALISPMPVQATTAAAAAASPFSTIMMSSAIGHAFSPAPSTTSSPRLVPAPDLTCNAPVLGNGVRVGTIADETMLVGRYVNIIRAQALVQSMYELEQIRERNRQLLHAVSSSRSAATTNSVVAASMVSAKTCSSKPTVVKAMTGHNSKQKFCHYGATYTSQQRHLQKHRGFKVPVINNERQRQQQIQPQMLKPLDPPPMLWKPHTGNKFNNDTKNNREQKVVAKTVSPITVVASDAARSTPTNSK